MPDARYTTEDQATVKRLQKLFEEQDAHDAAIAAAKKATEEKQQVQQDS